MLTLQVYSLLLSAYAKLLFSPVIMQRKAAQAQRIRRPQTSVWESEGLFVGVLERRELLRQLRTLEQFIHGRCLDAVRLAASSMWKRDGFQRSAFDPSPYGRIIDAQAVRHFANR